VNVDGSCSGLQHYSALLLDPVGAAAVNLIPSEKASDIYTQVAERAQALSNRSGDAELAPMWGGKVVRKVAKRPTMTMCYAVTKIGVRKQIQLAIRELDGGADGSYLGTKDSYQPAIYMAEKVWAAIGDTVVAARRGMDFLKQCARAVSKTGQPVRWKSPLGMSCEQYNVVQNYTSVQHSRENAWYDPENATARSRTVHVAGRKMKLVLAEDGTEVDVRKQASSVAPNYVHSLDSAHLMSTVNHGSENGIQDWSVIHDSFGTHACRVSLLNAVLREAFVQQYSDTNLLAKFREEMAEQLAAVNAHDFDLPEVPEMGTLDIEQVRQSQFFFA
jgi:DNA-directed RNA polymerase